MVEDYQENYRTGFISLYRSILNHWVFKDEKYLKWWIIMLFEVNHTEQKITRYYSVYSIKRGQSCNSLRTWANLFECSVKTVTKFFKLLESDGMISLCKIGKGKQALTLINITNYNDYQQKKKQELPQGVTQGGIQGLPSNNNDNNYNNTTTILNEADFKRYDGYIKQLSTEQMKIESIYLTYKLKKGSLTELTQLFIAHLKLYPEKHITYHAFTKHFFGWMGLQERNGKLNNFKERVKGSL